MTKVGQRDAYGQLMQLIRVLNDALVTLCESIIPALPEMEEPARGQVATALTLYATGLRDQLTSGGDFLRLAQTIELQTAELAKAKERLERVRRDLRGVYKGISETSGMRTQLVTLDEHLTVIAKQLGRFGPVVETLDDPILPQGEAGGED